MSGLPVAGVVESGLGTGCSRASGSPLPTKAAAEQKT